MIHVERLKRVRKVFSHSSCGDGTASAMICVRALRALGVDPEVRFFHYNTREFEDLPAEPGHLFVDITPPLGRWEEWRERDPIVLDHHDTAEEATLGLGGTYGYPEESGATLAFKNVMEPVHHHIVRTELKPPTGRTVSDSGLDVWRRFADLCRVRDTWRDELPEFEEASGIAHALAFFGSKELVEAAREDRVDFDQIWEVGGGLYRKILRKAELYARTAYRYRVSRDGRTYEIGVFNCSEKAISETAHILLGDGCDVAAGYFMLLEDGSPRIEVSLRSPKAGGIPVNKVAERLGGGGHPPSAGFRLKDGLNLSLSDVCRRIASGMEAALVPE